MKTDNDIVEQWLATGQTARLCGLDLKPRAHPLMPGTVQHIIRGQGSVYFFDQPQHNNVLLMKKFAFSKRPDDRYLQAVPNYLPGDVALFTATQRKLLRREHLDWFGSKYRDPNLANWIDGAILMPKVPGQPWASIADDLRDGNAELNLVQRLSIALSLAQCIEQMEAAGCSHRDLSGGNVFVNSDNRIYLIDCDCVYHSNLVFPINTSPGTNGYITPFLHQGDSHYDTRASWCERADRFALAVLIAEFLMIQRETPCHEDGSLFNQEALNHGDQSVDQTIDEMSRHSTDCADLCHQAIHAQNHDSCPSPEQWISVLRHELRQQRHHHHGSRVRYQCDTCGQPRWINAAHIQELQTKAKPIYCQTCLKKHLQKVAHERHQRNHSLPQASCEHCQRTIRLPREKLNRLRTEGKPVLCRSCLDQQLQQWNQERQTRDLDYPQVTCSRCGQGFRMNRHKRDELAAKAVNLLCRDCFATRKPAISSSRSILNILPWRD